MHLPTPQNIFPFTALPACDPALTAAGYTAPIVVTAGVVAPRPQNAPLHPFDSPLGTLQPPTGLTTSDYALLSNAQTIVVGFKPHPDRVGLLSIDRLLDRVAEGHYSFLIKRDINTVADAIEHDLAMAQLWADEDAARVRFREEGGHSAIKSKHANAEAQRRFRARRAAGVDGETEALRVEWKEACMKRDEAMEGWKAYVKVRHDAYTSAVKLLTSRGIDAKRAQDASKASLAPDVDKLAVEGPVQLDVLQGDQTPQGDV